VGGGRSEVGGRRLEVGGWRLEVGLRGGCVEKGEGGGGIMELQGAPRLHGRCEMQDAPHRASEVGRAQRKLCRRRSLAQ
jgi:hypothetical protein